MICYLSKPFHNSSISIIFASVNIEIIKKWFIDMFA